MGCIRNAEQLGDVAVLDEERLEAAVVKVRDEEGQPSVRMVRMRQAIPTRPEHGGCGLAGCGVVRVDVAECCLYARGVYGDSGIVEGVVDGRYGSVCAEGSGCCGGRCGELGGCGVVSGGGVGSDEAGDAAVCVVGDGRDGGCDGIDGGYGLESGSHKDARLWACGCGYCGRSGSWSQGWGGRRRRLIYGRRGCGRVGFDLLLLLL